MAKIILHGDCLVNRAAELHQLLLHHLGQTDEGLDIDLSTTGRCDLSFFQLLCAAIRSFSKGNKYLKLLNTMPEAVVAQFEKTGFGPACAACAHDDCFMKGKGMDCPVKPDNDHSSHPPA